MTDPDTLRPNISHEDEWWLFPRRWTWGVQEPSYYGDKMIGWDPVGKWGRRFTKWGAERAVEREIRKLRGEAA